jgi:hypothetical protein
MTETVCEKVTTEEANSLLIEAAETGQLDWARKALALGAGINAVIGSERPAPLARGIRMNCNLPPRMSWTDF